MTNIETLYNARVADRDALIARIQQLERDSAAIAKAHGEANAALLRVLGALETLDALKQDAVEKG